MIAKIPTKRRDKKSSFRDLTNYCLGITGHGEGSVLHIGLQNLYSPTSAAIEMEALATENTRCKDPAFHFILSWRTLENPTAHQVDEAVKIALKELDLENCQALWALQADTENLHVHVAVNRIDPETGRAIQPAGNWTKKALERAARKIEYAQGWGIEASGRYYVTPDGNIVEKGAKHPEAEVSQKARDLEVHTGTESLERIVKKQIAPILETSETWEKLHRRLAEHGFVMEKKGSGAILRAGDTVMKVSSVSRACSLSKLEKRLGEFQDRGEATSIQPQPSQAPTRRIGADLEDSWKRYNAERNAYLNAKAEALREKKEAHKKEFATLYQLQRDERQELYAKNLWKTRGREMNQLRSLMAYAQQKDRLTLREKHWEEIDDLKARYLKRFPSYKKWLAAQENEKLYELYRYPGKVLLAPKQSSVFDRSKPRSMDLKNYRPRKGGSCVAYCREGTCTADFSDMGKRILLNEDTLDKTSVVAALQLANQKWGATKITGSDDYKELCVAAAVEYNLKISNPDLAEEVERRRKMMLEKRREQDDDKARSEVRTEIFMRYAQAVGADRFRIIVTDFQPDGVKAFVFDRHKGGRDGKSATELSEDISRLDALEQKQHQNINVVPISDAKHHILIDDVSAEKLRQLREDGYSPACVIESSPGNFQAVLTVSSVAGDAQKDRLAANRLTKELNEKYGDPRLSGAVHAHRLPPFGNYKLKHQDSDGKFPATQLVEAEGGLCRQAFGKLQQLHAEFLKFEAKKEQERSLHDSLLSATAGGGSPNDAYWAHYRDIASRHGIADFSVVDAMIGTRMRVTGFSSGEIQMAIEENAPKMRHENMSAEEFRGKYQYRDWKRFAEETTQRFVFGARGERQFTDAEPYKRYYLKLEGRREREEVPVKTKALGATDPSLPSKEEIAALRLVDDPKIFTKPAKSGRYSGKILHIDTEKGYCVQLVGRRSLVVHYLDDLAMSPRLNEFVRVSYETGEKANITVQRMEQNKQRKIVKGGI